MIKKIWNRFSTSSDKNNPAKDQSASKRKLSDSANVAISEDQAHLTNSIPQTKRIKTSDKAARILGSEIPTIHLDAGDAEDQIFSASSHQKENLHQLSDKNKFPMTNSFSVDSFAQNKNTSIFDNQQIPLAKKPRNTVTRSNTIHSKLLKDSNTKDEINNWVKEVEERRRKRHASNQSNLRNASILLNGSSMSISAANSTNVTPVGTPDRRTAARNNFERKKLMTQSLRGSRTGTPKQQPKSRLGLHQNYIQSRLADTMTNSPFINKKILKPSQVGNLRKQTINLKQLVPSRSMKNVCDELKPVVTQKPMVVASKLFKEDAFLSKRNKTDEEASRNTSGIMEDYHESDSKTLENSESEQDSEFEDHFGNFTIATPFDTTPGHTLGHTPRRKKRTKKKKVSKTDHDLLRAAAKLNKIKENESGDTSMTNTPTKSRTPKKNITILPKKKLIDQMESESNSKEEVTASQPKSPEKVQPLADMFTSGKKITGLKTPISIGNIAKIPDLTNSKPAEKEPVKSISDSKPLVEPKPLMSLSSMFKKDTSKYACKTCASSFDVKLSKCPACEEPNPNYVAPAGGNSLASMFKKDNSKYSCKTCCSSFDIKLAKCPACEEPNPNATPASAPGNSLASMFKKDNSKYSCKTCCSSFDIKLAKCPACEEPNPKATAAPAPANSLASMFNKDTSKYSCKTCCSSFDIKLAKCPACEEPNPKYDGVSDTKKSTEDSKPAPSLSFGAKPAESKPTTTFSFGAKIENSKPAPSFSFGAKPAESKPEEAKPAPSFTFESKPAEDKPRPTFNFGASSSKPKAEEEKTKPSFSFGAATTASTTKTEEKPAPKFSFGSSTAKPAESESKPKPTFSFGSSTSKTPATATESEKPKPTFSFGKPEASQSSSGNTHQSEPEKPKPTFSFGKSDPASISSTPKPEAEKPKPVFSFGQTSTVTTKDKSKTVTPFSLAPKQVEPETKPKPVFSFGGNSNTGGSNIPASGTTPAQPFTFGQPTNKRKLETDSQPATKQPAFSFGGAAKPAEATKSTPFSFGQPAGSTNKPAAATPFSFGSSTQPATSTQNSGGFNFSMNTNGESKIESSNTSSVFQFGSNASSTPAKKTDDNSPFKFGNSTINTTTSNVSSTNNTPFKFGAANNASSSAISTSKTLTNSTMFGMNSTANNNMSTSSSTPFNFGGASNAAANTNVVPTASSTPFSFGSANTNNNNNNNTQSSGGMGLTQQNSQPNPSPFSFGAASSNPSGSSGSFNFGASSGGLGNSNNNNLGGGNPMTSSTSNALFGGSSNTGASADNPFGFQAGSAPPGRKIARPRRKKR